MDSFRNRTWLGTRVQVGDGVLLVLIPDSCNVKTIPFKVIVENRGRGEVRCGDTGYFLDCRLAVKDVDGKHARYTSLGRAAFAERIDRNQYAYVTLTSGQLRTWEFNIADAFEDLKAGDYLLTLETTWQFKSKADQKFSPIVTLSAKDVLFRVSE